MHEELYSMRKELAAILHGNRLLRSAVNEEMCIRDSGRTDPRQDRQSLR